MDPLSNPRRIPINGGVQQDIGNELNAALERLIARHRLSADQAVYGVVAFAWGIARRAMWSTQRLAEYSLKAWLKMDDFAGVDANQALEAHRLRRSGVKDPV